jgi:CRP/FNR family transcriptional regulator, anaerobic regulatory protein
MRKSPIADDGDALHFFSTCAFSSACIEQGFDRSRLGELHVLVEHVGPFAEGECIFREGDRFEAIAAVRAGTVKTFVNDAEGREQVQGFFLPGEVIGLNAISSDNHLRLASESVHSARLKPRTYVEVRTHHGIVLNSPDAHSNII